jgi:cysteine desulfurase
MLYFDHNATTPLLPAARKAWLDAVERFPGNPSSPHRLGSRAEAALADARQQLAAFLGCDALDIVWTSGASESANAVFHHVARTADGQQEVWVSALEHPCVIEAARHWLGARVKLVPASPDGVVEPGWLQKKLARRRPALVAVMAANNETGLLQPWRDVLALCREHRVPFFCDAAQWVGKLPARGLGDCDFVSGCAHKFGGPKGTGFLKVPGQGRFHGLIHGGPQEERRRAGTEDVAGVLAMMAALTAREAALATGEHEQRLAWRDRFEKELLQSLPGSRIVGAGRDRLWNTVSALMPVTDCQQRWVVKLDKAGCAVSTGSACASGKEEPSHVLAAMGLAAEAPRALRFSSGWETTRKDWQQLARKLAAVHREIAEA